MHSISILLGLWLHVFLVAVPLRNVKEYIEHVEEQKRKGATKSFSAVSLRVFRDLCFISKLLRFARGIHFGNIYTHFLLLNQSFERDAAKARRPSTLR